MVGDFVGEEVGSGVGFGFEGGELAVELALQDVDQGVRGKRCGSTGERSAKRDTEEKESQKYQDNNG